MWNFLSSQGYFALWTTLLESYLGGLSFSLFLRFVVCSVVLVDIIQSFEIDMNDSFFLGEVQVLWLGWPLLWGVARSVLPGLSLKYAYCEGLARYVTASNKLMHLFF